ncbi:Regulator of protease activity HflC, stomatin/prohibitin superfamily [Paenibacillus sp. 1_12]|uniref:SPFH domain-containing protein n=1 Tax=Paenibacillus sp. 1_12 TaxID=1566278 RepID=UPI0008EC8AD1|nr:SPFH domain-containing protein [Paenibacillus sp. 1_12]SFK76982.1 Regulator of protease activity HflC, stomatin/prohibitin superfamily [Paenibacillus sp. 1_12]
MKEYKAWAQNGFLGLLLLVIFVGLGIVLLINTYTGLGIASLVLSVILMSSMTIVQPNQALVVTFFGKYVGTIRDNGIWLTLPFSMRKQVSLRVRNFNSIKLKVNDIEGNPIEIAAVVVFRVVDSAKAMYDVDKYEQFVEIQSETALRHVASKYPYDLFHDSGFSLRGNSEEISNELGRELQERLSLAGVEVMEARLTHLAYSTEIASAMLQRQQASAIISARSMIVEGAVGMVQMAIAQIEQDGTIHLDEERKAAMINNLLVAIVSDRSASPIINTSSLY